MYEMSHVQNLDSELAAVDQAKVEAQHAAHKATEAAAVLNLRTIHGMPPIKPGHQPLPVSLNNRLGLLLTGNKKHFQPDVFLSPWKLFNVLR